ncbi:hypothetical protein [Labrys neptuniae]
MTQFIIMKRRGTHLEAMMRAPIFEDLVKAEKWAALYVEDNHSRFGKSQESIEVHTQKVGRVSRKATASSRRTMRRSTRILPSRLKPKMKVSSCSTKLSMS